MGMGQIEPGFTFIQYVRLLEDPIFLHYLIRSLRLTTISTIVCILFGYAAAYVMANGAKWVRRFITTLLFINIFVMHVVRVYALMIFLGNNGIIARGLIFFKITDSPMKLMYNELGVVIGLSIGALPFMVFPICSALDNIKEEQKEVALSLGANKVRTFQEITFPLSLPGVVSGILLTFSWNLSSYVVPALLGGGFSEMIANLIYRQALGLVNFPQASASAFVLLLITILFIFFINKSFERLIRGTVIK